MNRGSDAAIVGVEELSEGRASKGLRYWLISKPSHGETDTPTLRLLGGGKVLPVFSFEEEAEIFLLARGDSRRGWSIWEAEARELLPVLLGPSYAGVDKVVLDPILDVADAVSAFLVGVSRERFAGRLLEYLRGREGRRDTRIGQKGDGYG